MSKVGVCLLVSTPVIAFILMIGMIGGFYFVEMSLILSKAEFIVVVGGAMVATVYGISCYFTFSNPDYYAKALREAESDNFLHDHPDLCFATMVLTAIFFLSVEVCLLSRAYNTRLCIDAGECPIPHYWYYTVPIMIGTIQLLAMTSTASATLIGCKYYSHRWLD